MSAIHLPSYGKGSKGGGMDGKVMATDDTNISNSQPPGHAMESSQLEAQRSVWTLRTFGKNQKTLL